MAIVPSKYRNLEPVHRILLETVPAAGETPDQFCEPQLDVPFPAIHRVMATLGRDIEKSMPLPPIDHVSIDNKGRHM
jgi:hypothetical protein